MKVAQTEVGQTKVVFIDNPAAKSASIQFWFKAGSALENQSNCGIAHFLEHMFFKGSQKRPGSSIAHEIESYGGEVNAFTSFDYTCYYINSPATHMEQSLDILMDMVSNPQFLNEDILTERDVVAEEYKRSQDNPSQFTFHQMQKNSFSSGYKHSILGTPKHIQNFSRKQLIEFRNQFYNRSNAMILVAGPVDGQDRFCNIIKKYKMPEGASSQFGKFQLQKHTKPHHAYHTDVKHVALNILIPSPVYSSSEAPAEDIALSSLAHGETSRLFIPLIRDSSLASGVSGSTMYFHQGGLHFFKIICPPENCAKAIQKLLELIEQTLEKPFTATEIQKIQNQYIAGKIYEKESIEALAFSYGHSFAQSGDIYSEEVFIEKLKNVDHKQAQKALIAILQRTDKHYHWQLPRAEKQNLYLKLSERFDKKLKKILTPFTKDKSIKAKYPVRKSKYDKQVEMVTIKPGIHLIYRQNLQTPTFTFHAYLKGGLSEEKQATAGLHYLIARCLTFGHKSKSYLDLKNDLDFQSASLSGFSGKNAYGLTLHGQSQHFYSLMDDFHHTLFHPKFPQKYFSNEKKLIKRAIDNMMEDPLKRCFKLFNSYYFSGHPYAYDLIGNKESLKKIKLSDIKKVHESHLHKDELLFTYCGDLEKNKIIEYIEKMTMPLKGRKEKKKKPYKIKVRPTLLHLPFEREQTQIFIGYPGKSLQDQKDIYLRMLTTYLSGQSSDLFVEIRDKKSLCYAVQAVHHSALEAGYWGIYIGTSNEKASTAIDSIADLLNTLKSDGIAPHQFDRLKKMIIGQSILNLQTNEDYANHYSVPCLHGLGLDFDKDRETKMETTTVGQMNQFLQSFLSQKPIITVVGTHI